MSAIKSLLRSKIALTSIAAVILGGGAYLYLRPTATYQFVTVTRGPLSETVSLTGNTTPVEDVTLGFQITGTVAAVYHKLGEAVTAGETIASLNTSTLSAALA